MATVVDKSNPSGPLDQSYDNNLFDITPSDTVKLRMPIQALYVTVGGNVAMRNAQGETVTITYLAGGPYYVAGVNQIYATGTTATGIKGLRSRGLM